MLTKWLTRGSPLLQNWIYLTFKNSQVSIYLTLFNASSNLMSRIRELYLIVFKGQVQFWLGFIKLDFIFRLVLMVHHTKEHTHNLKF